MGHKRYNFHKTNLAPTQEFISLIILRAHECIMTDMFIEVGEQLICV